jgi:hypothetical protein
VPCTRCGSARRRCHAGSSLRFEARRDVDGRSGRSGNRHAGGFRHRLSSWFACAPAMRSCGTG